VVATLEIQLQSFRVPGRTPGHASLLSLQHNLELVGYAVRDLFFEHHQVGKFPVVTFAPHEGVIVGVNQLESDGQRVFSRDNPSYQYGSHIQFAAHGKRIDGSTPIAKRRHLRNHTHGRQLGKTRYQTFANTIG
jgi:hypothetical protein